jgi:hypothetical protein
MNLRWLIAAVAVMVLLPRAAFADATPVQLILTYLPNVSNTGTDAASGIAELVLLEGEARVSATGLPKLDEPERYVAWLVNTQTNSTFRLGDFNASAENDIAKFEEVLPDAIPSRQWNLLLVTIEKDPEPSRPGNKHSIAGTFPRSQSDPTPAMLPNTGGADELSAVSSQPSAASRADWLAIAGPAALVGLIAGGAGYVVGRRRVV